MATVCKWIHADDGAFVMEWTTAEDAQAPAGRGGNGTQYATKVAGHDAQRRSARNPGRAAGQEHATNLSYQEQRQLRRIETDLLRSDRQLGAMLALFGRLYAGQGMPAWEQVPAPTASPRRWTAT